MGYDDNRSMTRGNVRLHGASGALPAWIGTVKGLQEYGMLSQLVESTWATDSAFSELKVEGETGFPEVGGTALALVDGTGGKARRFYVPLGREREPLEGRQHWMWP